MKRFHHKNYYINLTNDQFPNILNVIDHVMQRVFRRPPGKIPFFNICCLTILPAVNLLSCKRTTTMDVSRS